MADSVCSLYNGSSYTFGWQGRRLVSAVKGTDTMSFAYNDEGLRVSKTVNGVTTHYVYDGNVLLAEYTDNEAIVYIYDANDSLIGFKYRASSYEADVWDVYWYGKNLQGDVLYVYNASGTKLISYTYNAWGNTTVTYSNGGATTSAVKNNLTYRGYYYDSDLSMYYLQSRYYDPAIGRFINADGALYGTMLGFNLFIYCENNPATRLDPTGDYSVDIKDDDGNPLNDWLFEGGAFGGGASGYYGAGSSYYNYSVYKANSTYDANLGGYHSSGVTSAMTNMSYYVVPGAVTVVDSMATTKCGTTTIYRSVSEAEAMDIMNTGQFNLSPSGMECKQFGFDLLETKQFGDMMKQKFVVSAEIPNKMLNKMYTGGVDPNIFRSGTLTVYENQLGEFNLAVNGTIRIVP